MSTAPQPHREIALVERYFVGALAEPEWRALFRHLESCASCRRTFGDRRAAGRAVEGRAPGDLGLAAAESEQLLRVVLEAEARRRKRRRLGAAAGAAAIAASFLLALRPREPSVLERGAESLPVLAAHCVSEGAPEPVRPLPPGAGCPIGSAVKITVTPTDSRWRHAAVVGVDERLAIGLQARVRLDGSPTVPVPGHYPISRAGPLLFIAFWSEEAMADAELDRAIDRLRAAGSLAALEAMPLPGGSSRLRVFGR